MGLLRYFKKKKMPEHTDDDVEWCIYDLDVVCDSFFDCQDCCWYEEWQRRGGKDADNFDDYGLDQSQFDYNHYDDVDVHKRR